MKVKLLIGLLIVALITVPLFAVACGEEETLPPPEEEEEGPPPGEEEEEANWWDKFGEPQYGGTITVPITRVAGINFDTETFIGSENNLWYESLFTINWTLDREIWPFTTGGFTPDQYWAGQLAESWDITDLQTITVYIREGVYWQDKWPVNGREFTAYDVQAHYDRVLGTGDYTEPNPMYVAAVANLESVTATDDYTAIFKFKAPSGMNFQTISDLASVNEFEAPEYAALSQEERQDWHNAVGTAAWILVDYLDGAYFKYEANPNYYGYDERYPDNQLPYVNELVMLVIPELSTQVAALRTGEIDILAPGNNGVAWQQAESLANSNPEFQTLPVSLGGASLAFRADAAPFTDIRVREALQLSINRDAIASGIYGGLTDGVPSGLLAQAMTGYVFSYEDWPQELKDEYAYNPTLAMELLAEAAADGVFEPNDLGGFDTNVVTSSGSNLISMDTLQAYKSYFKEIGVDMDIQTVDSATYEAVLRGGQFDQMVYGIPGVGLTLPPTFQVGSFYSKSPACYPLLTDPGYDALFEQFFAATTPEECAETLVAMDRFVLEQHWLVTSCASFVTMLWQPYLQGYSGEYLWFGQGLVYSHLWVTD